MHYKISEITEEQKELDRIVREVEGGEKIYTCIQCGSCSATCPGNAENKYSHRQFWRLLQLGNFEEIFGSENEWNCTTCGLCEARCPRGIPLTKIILRLREAYSDKKGTPENQVRIADAMQKRNINGDDQKNRLLWFSNMGEGKAETEAAMKKDKAEVVYYTGCVSALFPQAYKIPQSLSLMLVKAGVDFGFLGEGEWCCGYPLLGSGAGEEALKEYAEHTYEALQKMGAKTVVMSCPTCLYVFKEVYTKYVPGFNNIEILHYSQYLPRLISEGRLKFKQGEETVTYHDPCDLGRKGEKVFDEPRELISLTGAKICEMRFNKNESKCCGGGGNIEMQNGGLSESISVKRAKEAVDTGASAVVTTCQQCKRSLQKGARNIRARIKVYDLLEYLAERLEG
ncbi:MAG: hypothetical protein DBX47_07695 [Clostridiales bacterium]|nr:MAG: hypothetical protein DBX47_07695 [Clostridiales bacterium]